MDKITLEAKARPSDQTSAALRRDGKIPGVVYGNTANTTFIVEENALRKAYIKAGESTLVDLQIDGGSLPVLFQSVDQHPVSDRMIHVDFYAVDMKKEVEADVHIRFEGESIAVKDLSAILVTALDTVTVRCLPANLPHDLAVDLSKLTEFGSTITVADIVVPQGVEILNDKEDVIVIAQEPRAEEVEEAPVAEGAEGAADGAAPAEGAPAEGEGEKKED